jgi:hypothetical protein
MATGLVSMPAADPRFFTEIGLFFHPAPGSGNVDCQGPLGHAANFHLVDLVFQRLGPERPDAREAQDDQRQAYAE